MHHNMDIITSQNNFNEVIIIILLEWAAVHRPTPTHNQKLTPLSTVLETRHCIPQQPLSLLVNRDNH